MDSRAYLQKLKELPKTFRKDKKKAVAYAGGSFAGVIALTILAKAAPGIWTQLKLAGHAVLPSFSVSGVVSRYGQALDDVQAKADALRRADEENRRLNLENANLRLKLESAQFECGAQAAAKNTQKIEFTLDQETGSKVGRSLATIGYKLPTNLLPPQLYTLAVSYFKGKEDEKAVVILTFLTSMEEEEAYKTSKNYLMTGISWYRLDNYELAESYFDKVLKAPVNPDVAGSDWGVQAKIWKALVAERQGKKEKSQYFLREVLEEHPHSTEAAWVNSLAAENTVRAPAAQHGAAKHGEAKKHAAESDVAETHAPVKAPAHARAHEHVERHTAALPTETRAEKLHAQNDNPHDDEGHHGVPDPEAD